MPAPDIRMQIDELNLHKEWQNQPQQMMNWGRFVAECQRMLDEAEVAKSLVEAELDSDIRENCTTYGLDKITEAAIKSTIPKQPEYTSCVKKIIRLTFELNEAKAVVRALEHRKSALGGMTELFIRDYHSDKSAGSADKESIRARGRRRQDEDVGDGV